MDIKNVISRLILVDIQDPALLEKYPFAGYILFYKDIDQSINGWKKLKDFNKYYKEFYLNNFGFDVLRSIDQEGGVVFRFDYPDFPAVCSQFSVKDEESAYLIAKLNGLILKFLGFNVNFSPVMDVNTNRRNPIIAVRSFGDDFQRVARMSKKYLEAYIHTGIISTGKHFPGHGDTDIDSHIDLPISVLSKEHLYPFEYNKEVLPSIMTAHVVYKNIDSLPATISKKVIDLFQPFNGIIFSDALNMKALNCYDFNYVLVSAILAGVDVLLILGDDELKIQSIEFLAKEVEKNDLLRKIIISKYEKVNKFLEKWSNSNEDNEEFLINQIENLKKWMIYDYRIPVIEKGDRKRFYNLLKNQNLKVVILSSPYIKLIGINEKIKEVFITCFKEKNIDFIELVEVKDIDLQIDQENTIFVNLVLDDSYKELISKFDGAIVFSFANPYLEGNWVVNFGGFSRVHLDRFISWFYEVGEGMSKINVV